MLRKLLLLAMTFVVSLTFAQEDQSEKGDVTYEVKFKNTPKRVTMVFDDPILQPKFQVQARFFHPVLTYRMMT